MGCTRRRLSFFLMVLCYSRLMYLEFHRLAEDGVLPGLPRERICRHRWRAFAPDGRQLKSAVLQRLVGTAPVFNPKYVDFSRHWGFEISPRNIRAGQEKGRVENGVGFVKKTCSPASSWLTLRR